MPAISGIPRLIDPAAGRCDYVTRIPRIKIDGKDIGIVDDAVLDNPPGLAAISGLVRKIPGAGIDDVRVMRVDCQRFDMHKTRRTGCKKGVQVSPESVERNIPKKV